MGLSVFLSLALFASAQGPTALVRPDPLTFGVGQDQIATLNVVLENAQDAYGIDVRAQFDPGVVEVVDANLNQTGVQMIPGNFPQPDFLLYNIADNQNGALMYVAIELNGTPPVSGSGIVFSIILRGKVAGKQSPFTISFVDLADRQGRKLAVDHVDGIINVVQSRYTFFLPLIMR